jgi:RNA recognition motif-containing protein
MKKSVKKSEQELDAEFEEFESLIGGLAPEKKEEKPKPTLTETIKEVKTISAQPTYNIASILQPTNYSGEKRIRKPTFEPEVVKKKETESKKRNVRQVGDVKWQDESLEDWPDNDFRIFVGNLGNDVNENLLIDTFSKYPSFAKAKVIRDKNTSKSKGYGFISFLDGEDFLSALTEYNGKYIGSRPCQMKKSKWEDRNPDTQQKKKKKKMEFM